MAADEQWLAPQGDIQLLGQFGAGARLAQFTLQADGPWVVRLQPTSDMPAEQVCQLHVITELGMGIEGQVISDQVDAVLQQRLEPPLFQSGDRSGFALPE